MTSDGIRAKLRVIKPPPRNSLIINWGNRPSRYDQNNYTVLNPLPLVNKISCKLRFFRHVGNSDLIPLWTSDIGQVENWLRNGLTVVVRSVTGASGGKGIDIIEGTDALIPIAPLYTVYQKKTAEFRIHMFRNSTTNEWEARDVQKKAAVKDDMGNHRVTNWRVRNHSNGFVFIRNTIEPTPPRVIEVAKQFMTEHFNGLHFLALDIVYHAPTNRALVLEGNSAPGLEGRTIENYIQYFKECLQ